MKHINIRNSVLCLGKVFLIFLVVLCFGLIGVVLWANPAYASNAGGLPVCKDNLNTCTANLNTCNTTLDTCNSDLAACEAESLQIFPGDGYANPDAFGVSGHGPALSYTDNGDGTFTDNNTKFIWEKKTTVSGGVHNVNNIYTWTASSGGTAPNGTLFTGFLVKLNNTCKNDETIDCSVNGDADCAGVGGPCGFAGHRDWCIPNVKQLHSILDYSKANPASSVPGFTASSYYWSATTTLSNAPTVEGVRFSFGAVNNIDKHGSFNNRDTGFFARAVRPCQ